MRLIGIIFDDVNRSAKDAMGIAPAPMIVNRLKLCQGDQNSITVVFTYIIAIRRPAYWSAHIQLNLSS